MEFLTEAHAELNDSQQSMLMQRFEKSSFDLKVVAIGAGLIAGIACAAFAWRGELSDRVYFCLQSPKQELQCFDKNNRPYRMTKWHWDKWEQDGRPKTIIYQDTETASNPFKPFWACAAFISFGIAGWKLRHLQDTERKLAV